VLASARLRRPGLPIVMVSGLPEAAEVAASEGVPFFPKPVNLERLRRAVAQLLEHEGPGERDQPVAR
jgi:hypothetical protein